MVSSLVLALLLSGESVHSSRVSTNYNPTYCRPSIKGRPKCTCAVNNHVHNNILIVFL